MQGMFDGIPGLEAVTGTLAVPSWAAGVAIVLFIVVGILALRRAGAGRTIGAIAQVAVLLVVAAGAWTFLNHSIVRERDAERRALDLRALELTARAVTPGSPLACLDAIAGETVENACENALFASAETTASALSYIGARLTLLADGMAHADQRDPNYEAVLAEWRRTLETDRFGLVARVLATRDGCDADHCAAFRLLTDTSRVSANLKERTFDQHMSRHAAAWGHRSGTAVAGTPASPPNVPSLAASSMSPPNFPSAASIPAVSIMNAEPTGTVQAGTAEPIANPPTPPRRPRRPANQTAAPPAATAPDITSPARPQ